MSLHPQPTSHVEKERMIDVVKERLLKVYDQKILAIGVYGSFALDEDGPYSDINVQVVTYDGQEINDFQFIYPPFNVSIQAMEKQQFILSAKRVDHDWSLNVTRFIHMSPIYDPVMFFTKMKNIHLQITSYEIKEVMRDYLVSGPYVTIAKLRNLRLIQEESYLLLHVIEFCEQSAKLIGLANRYYYRSKTRMLGESLMISNKPNGYEQLVHHILAGDWASSDLLYEACEQLWDGLNQWCSELGIKYYSHTFPF